MKSRLPAAVCDVVCRWYCHFYFNWLLVPHRFKFFETQTSFGEMYLLFAWQEGHIPFLVWSRLLAFDMATGSLLEYVPYLGIRLQVNILYSSLGKYTRRVTYCFSQGSIQTCYTVCRSRCLPHRATGPRATNSSRHEPALSCFQRR